MSEQVSLTTNSPFGPLTVTEEDQSITRLRWGAFGEQTSAILREAATQLDAYFAGNRRVFDLPFRFLDGLAGQVQAALCAIPWGETRSYGELAASLGVSAQAIGQACGANAIPILIPCHRVLGRKTLGGFSAPGGVETKIALLKHEGAAGLLI